MSDITLYFNPLSQPSRAVFALLLLGEVPADFRVLEIGVDTVKPEFMAINPFGTVPAILHNNFPIYESMSIMRYITRTQKNCAKYYPEVPHTQALIDMYLDWHHQGMRVPSGQYLASHQTEHIHDQKAFDHNLEHNKKKFIHALNRVETVFLGGEKKFRFINNSELLSIADLVCLMEIVAFFQFNFDYADWPNITHWLYTVFSISAIRKSCEYLLGQVIKNVPEPNQIIRKILA